MTSACGWGGRQPALKGSARGIADSRRITTHRIIVQRGEACVFYNASVVCHRGV